MKKFKFRIWLVLHGFKWYCLGLIGKLPSHLLRRFLYNLFGLKFGKETVIYGGAEIRRPEWIRIGKQTVVGNNAILDGRMGIEIGENVNISSGVWIWTVQHDYRDANFKDIGGKVIVGSNSWLSCRVTVLPGVRIGEGAVVAAGSVVTKDVEPYTVVGGIPAKKIADRPKDIKYNLVETPPIPFI